MGFYCASVIYAKYNCRSIAIPKTLAQSPCRLDGSLCILAERLQIVQKYGHLSFCDPRITAPTVSKISGE